MDTELQMKETFQQNGSLLIKNVISKELSHYLTHVFLRMHHIDTINGYQNNDPQVKDTLVTILPNPYNDTFLEMLWPIAEKFTGEELIPTYSCARLYGNGNVLDPHTDRPSCEVSMTIQLGKSHDYVWPVFAEDKQYNLEEGDAMMYLGCDKKHWRKECKGPEGYYSGQMFVHFVKANGNFKEFAGDKRWQGEIPFVLNRIEQMQTKNG
jgi:hypothetical protein